MLTELAASAARALFLCAALNGARAGTAFLNTPVCSPGTFCEHLAHAAWRPPQHGMGFAERLARSCDDL